MKYLFVFCAAVALLLFSFSLWGETTKSPADSSGSFRGNGSASTHEPVVNNSAQETTARGTGIVVGRLVSKSEYVVAWARIFIVPVDSNQPEAQAYSFVSGKDGTFMAKYIKPGRYYVVVTHSGYKPVKPFIIKIYPGKRTVFDVILEERLLQVPTIIDVAKRFPVEIPVEVSRTKNGANKMSAPSFGCLIAAGFLHSDLLFDPVGSN